ACAEAARLPGAGGDARASGTVAAAVSADDATQSAPLPAPSGLDDDEARRRLAEHGPNALPETPATPLWRRFLAQFQSALIYLLLFALVFDVATWLWEEGGGWPAEAI